MNEKVFQLLQNTKFPKNRSRKNVSSVSTESFVLGDVNYRGQKSLGGRTRGPSRYNSKFPELFAEVKKLMENHDPDFKYTTIQVNKNIQSKPHVDKNNIGLSYIIALGNFTGGELILEGKHHNIKNNFLKFDGRLGHWVEPFSGTRYSLVFFTHTFKPPCGSLRNLEVKKDGLYKKGILIKSY